MPEPRFFRGQPQCGWPTFIGHCVSIAHCHTQDVEHWLNCRNCEIRNALEHRDVVTVARCGSLVAQGAAMLANISNDVSMNG